VIEPFTIDIPQADLDDLADRLTRTRWPDELPGADWDYGIPLARAKELVEHWLTTYDWRKHEAQLNELPQYTTEIDGQNIHFVHVRSANPDALPLILTHGWPGSFLEFLDVIEPLTAEFHLVIPSIPGFGFSGPTHEKGWGVDRVARAWAELMSRLGYDRYGAQGGDWGSVISRALANVAPDQVVGVHLNYLPTPPLPGIEAELSEQDLGRLDTIKALLAQKPGFQVLMATTPQTIAYGLTDSPVSQLTWIAEKFDEWSDPRSPIDLDRLLTNVALYWLTGTANSSSRLRKESPGPAPYCDVPIGVAVFPYDITLAVRPLVERQFTVARWTEFDRGGHFAATEVPDLLAADVIAFFESLRPKKRRDVSSTSSDARS
jgi:pimeloyl-ACP methyl ester carboxylesterase